MGPYKPTSASAPSRYRDNVDHVRERYPRTPEKGWFSKPGYGYVFVISLLVNVVYISSLVRSKIGTNEPGRSKYAGLARTVPKAWGLNHAGNDSSWAELWDQHSSYDVGVVAFDDAYAKAMDLPRAQRWPWDSDKGIYILNAYHNLHCIKNLRTSIEEYRSSSPQSVPWPHVQHCLLVLRDEVMCNADDTPRYTGYQPSKSSALGQVRMCRDWGALEEWAMDKERVGCWRHVPGEEGVDGFSNLDRYRFCPESSPYEEMARTSWLNGEG